MDAAGDDLHDRLRGERGLQRVPVRPPGQPSATSTDHHETLINREEAQDFLPLLVRLQDEPIADNVCIPLYFLAQAGQAERHAPWCRSARAPTRTSSATGGASTTGRSTRSVYQPARTARSGWCRRLPALARRRRRGVGGEDLEIQRRARARPGAVLGRRRLLVGRHARPADAATASRSAERSTVRSRACCRTSHRDARQPRASSASYLGAARRAAARARGAAEDPVPGDEAAPARAPADARRQADDGACGRGARAVPRSRRRRFRDAPAAVATSCRTASASAC